MPCKFQVIDTHDNVMSSLMLTYLLLIGNNVTCKQSNILMSLVRQKSDVNSNYLICVFLLALCMCDVIKALGKVMTVGLNKPVGLIIKEKL